jgi:hypothetical protein
MNCQKLKNVISELEILIYISKEQDIFDDCLHKKEILKFEIDIKIINFLLDNPISHDYLIKDDKYLNLLLNITNFFKKHLKDYIDISILDIN